MTVAVTESTGVSRSPAARPGRRAFLGSLAALGAGALFPGCASVETGAAARRIDVHHHIAPPAYSAALKAMMRGHAQWSVEESLEDMDKSGIATAITSLINPGMQAWAGDVAGRAQDRARVERIRGAARRATIPGRFGSFASIPFPDIEGSMREIEYAFDTLKADGIYLWTSYGGKLLGDPGVLPDTRGAEPPQGRRLHPPGHAGVLREDHALDLDQRDRGAGGHDPHDDQPGIPGRRGALSGHPLDLLAQRRRDAVPAVALRAAHDRRQGRQGEGAQRAACTSCRKFYYDTAQGNHAGALAALMKLAPVSQVLYGTDFPFRDGAEENAGLGGYGFSAADMRAINRENALTLMPRLKV